MGRSTPATSEEDYSATLPQPITPNDLIYWATTEIVDPDREWLIAIYLNHRYEVLGRYLMYAGHTCAVLAPLDIKGMLDAAESYCTTHIVTVCHHGQHAWQATSKSYDMIEAIRQHAHAVGLRHHTHVIQDCLGLTFTLRLNQLAGGAPLDIGSSGETSSPS